MTREQVLSIAGFHPDTVRAAIAHLRANSRSPYVGADATALVRNEGLMQGIHHAADILQALLEEKRKADPQKPKELYPQPKTPVNPNNQPR